MAGPAVSSSWKGDSGCRRGDCQRGNLFGRAHPYRRASYAAAGPTSRRPSFWPKVSRLGFKILRLKTGTPMRLHADSINWKVFIPSPAMNRPFPFPCSPGQSKEQDSLPSGHTTRRLQRSSATICICRLCIPENPGIGPAIALPSKTRSSNSPTRKAPFLPGTEGCATRKSMSTHVFEPAG